ncbi:hypothetical protein C8F01DRAFT_1105293 [Mycena amicta]|nr:hypothetical protein C8F01DRAFT_1105293 [Mycena amicta]
MSMLASSQPFGFLLPQELCALIAYYASRDSIASLCLVSRAFCALFAPLLYENIMEPSLTIKQCSLLVRALSTANQSTTCIRRLRVIDWEYQRPSAEFSVNACQNALINLNHANLRSLHWGLSSKLHLLNDLLCDQDSFPNLKELFVTCRDMARIGLKNFAFMERKDLEVLGLALHVDVNPSFQSVDSEERRELTQPILEVAMNMLLDKLTSAMRALPLNSPHLHTFRFHLMFVYEDELDSTGYSDLFAMMRLLHIPALRHLDLRVDFNDILINDTEDKRGVDLSMFLANQPGLEHISLDMFGTHIAAHTPFRPPLQSFSGSPQNAAIVLSLCVQLQALTICMFDATVWHLPSFDIPPLPSHAGLEQLSVLVYDKYRNALKMSNILSPLDLEQLASSFPNLQQLDVPLSSGSAMVEYTDSLCKLSALRQIRLREYERRLLDPARSLSESFPSQPYRDFAQNLLPSLPHLMVFQHVLSTDDMSPNDVCDCDILLGECRECEELVEMMRDRADISIEYTFVVVRSRSPASVEVILGHSEIVDDRYHFEDEDTSQCTDQIV